MSIAFHFAWCDPGTPFDPVEHAREDEQIVRARVEQLETEFATLSIDIRNPRIGLLNAGRKVWAWWSWSRDGGEAEPLFFGRLVAVPSNLHREIVTVQLLARPEDFGLQKQAVAAGLRVLPYYDPVFIRPELADDADVVLEARTEVWHIDRNSHEVSISDLVVGEDGTLEFLEHEVPYESVEITLDQPPIRAVAVEAEVSWTQSVEGHGLQLINNMVVETLAGTGLISGWPKAGGSLGGGWSVDSSSAASPYMKMTDNDWGGWYSSYLHHLKGKPPFALMLLSSYSASGSTGGDTDASSTDFAIIDDTVTLNLAAGYKADRARKDIVRFTLVADSQPIVTMPDDDDVLELKVAGNDVGVAIGSPLRRSYFPSGRGMQSIQYVLQLARARIVARSRAVQIKWKCTFERAVELSLRKNALLHDRRIPGGQAVGKIVGYSFGLEGGEASGEVTIASCIGYGGSIEETAGEPCYVVDGYVDGYQHRDGQIIVLGPSDVGFETVRENANDDGLVFPLQSVPASAPVITTVETVPLVPVAPTHQGSTQVDDCGNTTSVSVSSNLDTGPWNDWLGGIETMVNFQLQPVEGGPFETVYSPVVTGLKLTKQIDLEAPPSP